MKNIFKTSLLVVLSCLMAGSVWGKTIYSFTVTSSTLAKGTYNATGGTAECTRDMSSDDQVVVGSQTFFKPNQSTKWNFNLENNTLAAGDVITFTLVTKENKSSKGIYANDVEILYDFIKLTPAKLVITVKAGDAFIGKSTVTFSRRDSEPRFGTFEITREDEGGGEEEPSHDATLKSLTYGNDDTSVPGFTATKLDYEVELPYGTADVPKVKAEKNDPKASDPVITQATTLPGTATIVVTPEEGDPKTYTVTFTVAEPSHDATLSGITYGSAQTDVPGFSTNVLDYTVSLAKGITSAPTVQATATAGNKATISYTQATTLPGTAKIIVTAQDGNTKQTYTVTFEKYNGFPVVTSCTFANQKGTAEITQPIFESGWPTNHGTITAVLNFGGDLTKIIPTFAGQDVDSWNDQGSQKDFSNGTVEYRINSEGGAVTTYDVTITMAPEVKPNNIILSKTELKLTEGGSETLTATVEPDDAYNKKVIWSSSDKNVATVDENGNVNAVAQGTAIITVTADANPQVTKTCTVTVKEEEMPQTDLTVHVPEIYEESVTNKGYGGTLSTFEGREYEVYYIGRDASDQPSVALTPSGDKVKGITTSSSSSACKADDGWFELKSCNGKGGDTNATTKDEFTFDSKYSIKMQSGHEMIFQVKGFDQFSIYGKDNNKDKTNRRQLDVYIDDDKKSGDPDATYSIRRYEMSPSKLHVIKVVGTGGSDSKLNGFSLRISNTPIVRYLDGPKEQTVYQTDSIQPVVYKVRRAKSYNLKWGDGLTGIPGVTAVAGTNDTVYIQGVANAPVGKYTYTLEALDEQGNVASQESGTITIETHIDDCADGNDLTTNVAEQMKPLSFRYHALNTNDISFSCDISGLNIAFDTQNQIATISGIPAVETTEGPHTYTLKVEGGNTVTGTITIVVPNPIFGPIPAAKTKDGQEITYYFVVHHAANVTITGLPNDFTVSYNPNNDTVTVKGTPNIGSGYPKVIEYTVTATPRYTGKQTQTEKGKLTVLDPNAKAIMVVTKETTNDDLDPLSKYFVNEGYDITCVPQDEIKTTPMDAFGLILITDEADADHKDVLNLIREGEKPMLNMKGFTYSVGRLGWGEPDNGTKDTLTNHSAMIYVQNEHPIFESLNKQIGDSIMLFDGKKLRAKYMNGVMPIKVFGDSIPGSYCLATGYTRNISDYFIDGPKETMIHEVPVSAREGAAKYICFPLALQSLEYMTEDGLELVRNIADYLMSDQSVEIEAPVLQLNRLVIGDYEAEIDQDKNYIILELPDKIYDSLDSLRHITPVVELEDPVHTHWTPVMPVDLMTSYLIKFPYFAVSDYINRNEEPNAEYVADRGLDEVYAEGDWITLYDIYGRIIATTNESIYTMDLPRGMYIAVTASGASIKVMR